MAKVFIGIPSVRDYQPFINSMAKFIPLVQKEHEVKIAQIKAQMVDKARNTIVDKFLESGMDYLLFLDDDHEGHTIEMFNALLNSNVLFSSIKSHTRFFPYSINLLDYSGHSEEKIKYKMKEETEGVHECDLIGFGMALIKKELFNIISPPYFVAKDNRKEDNYFCDLLLSKGIKPVGIFDYCLSHQGIDSIKAKALKEEGLDQIFKSLEERFPGKQLKELKIIA